MRRCFYHWGFTLLPGTLWLAWVLSGWRRRGARPQGAWTRPTTRGGAPAPFTVMQVRRAPDLGVISCHGVAHIVLGCDFLLATDLLPGMSDLAVSSWQVTCNRCRR